MIRNARLRRGAIWAAAVAVILVGAVAWLILVPMAQADSAVKENATSGTVLPRKTSPRDTSSDKTSRPVAEPDSSAAAGDDTGAGTGTNSGDDNGTGPQPSTAPDAETDTNPAVNGDGAGAGVGSEPMLVNKEHALAADYVPADLRVVQIPFSFSEDSPRRMMRDEAAGALEKLFAQAERDGIELAGVSGYRSYETQQAVFASHVQSLGSEEAANRVSAYPGQSEHQTGLAMDVSSPSVGYQLTETLGETEEGRWLVENAPDFGFIIRYPQGKEEITGYQYEPWHLRYVGAVDASQIAERDVTLEEYLGKTS